MGRRSRAHRPRAAGYEAEVLDRGFPDELIDPIGPAEPVQPGEPLDEAVTEDVVTTGVNTANTTTVKLSARWIGVPYTSGSAEFALDAVAYTT